MIAQTGSAVVFSAHYRDAGVGKPGLGVTVDVYRGASRIVEGAAAPEIGGGVYWFTLGSGLTGTPGAYHAVFMTAGAVDQQHIVQRIDVGAAGVDNLSQAKMAQAVGGLLEAL